MCGIFGLVRCGNDHTGAAGRNATRAFLSLGLLAQERGTDAAGVALLDASSTSDGEHTRPEPRYTDHTSTFIDGCRIIKDTKPFSRLPLVENYSDLADARILLGHTRAASQGAVDRLPNASPLLAGALVGTHNGDIDVSSVPARRAIEPLASGETDSERLLWALHAARKDRRKVTGVLKAIRGRAALAWVDRTRTDRLLLARAALSPLCTAYDQYGNFYYASNPHWFRRIQEDGISGVSFHDITMIPEGHLVTVSTLTGKFEDVRRFTPTCRERDLRTINSVAHRGFTQADRAADLALHRHKVEVSRLPKAWPSLTAAPDVIVEPPKDATAKASAKSASTRGNTADYHATLVDEPPTAGYDGVDLDEVEELCWAFGDFDYSTYENILEADPEEATYLVDRLRKEVAATR